MKKCNKCGELKPLTEFYSQEKTKKNGEKYIYYRPDCIECTKSNSSNWQKDHPERYKEIRHKYGISEKGKMKYREYARQFRRDGRYIQWQRDNKDKVNKHAEKWRTNKTHKIQNEELKLLYDYCNASCMYCGMTEEEHKELYGQKLHRDHAVNNGSDGIDNCVLACRCCNSSKSDNDWDEWYINSRVYNEENYIMIEEWLDLWK